MLYQVSYNPNLKLISLTSQRDILDIIKKRIDRQLIWGHMLGVQLPIDHEIQNISSNRSDS